MNMIFSPIQSGFVTAQFVAQWSLKPADLGTPYAQAAQVSREVSAGRMSSTPYGRLVMEENAKITTLSAIWYCSNHQ